MNSSGSRANSSSSSQKHPAPDALEVERLLEILKSGNLETGTPVSIEYAFGTIVKGMNSIAHKKAQHEAEAERLERQVESVKKELAKRDEDLEAAKEEIKQLGTKVENYKAELADWKAKACESQNHADEKKVKIESINMKPGTERCQFEDKLIEAEQKISDLEVQIADTVAEKDVLKGTKKEMKVEIKTLKKENRQAQKEIACLLEEKAAAVEKCGGLLSTSGDVAQLQSKLNEERRKLAMMNQEMSRRFKFYLTPTFQRFMRNLPSPLYPNSVIPVGARERDLSPFTKLQALPFLTLDSRLLIFEGLHALAFCTSPMHEAAEDKYWVSCPLFDVNSGRDVELFLKNKETLRYAGAFRCHSTKDWSERGVAVPDQIGVKAMLHASTTTHPQKGTRLKQELLDGYGDSSLRLDCLLMECIGFNHALYNNLLGKRFSGKSKGSGPSPGPKGHKRKAQDGGSTGQNRNVRRKS